MTSKTLFTKEKKKEKLDLIKVKTFALLKILLQKIKNWQQIGRKYLQITFITMDYILNL